MAELSARLRDKGYSESVSTSVIDRLKELNYLDDAAVARQWARSYAVNNLWGDRKIAYRLREMGIGSELVDDAIAEIRQDFPQRKAVIGIIRKRFPGRLTGRSISAKDEQRLVRHLLSKGFSPPLIFEVLAEPAEEDDSAEGQ